MGEAFWVPVTAFAGELGDARLLCPVLRPSTGEPGPRDRLLVAQRTTTGQGRA